MTSAHLVCHECRQVLHIGKIRYGADETRHGFAHGKYTPQQLSALIEAFLAVHLEHKVSAYAEQDFDTRDWSGYTALRPMPTVLAAKLRVRTLMVGPVEVRAEPHDGPSSEYLATIAGNNPMQPSGEVGRFEVDDQPSPPADP